MENEIITLSDINNWNKREKEKKRKKKKQGQCECFWNHPNYTMLLSSWKQKIINRETFILNSNNTYNTYKQGMADSLTNTMGPSQFFFLYLCTD